MFDIRAGDCLQVLPTLPAESVQCVVTSPPYYGLRDYGTATWEGGSAECDHKTGKNARNDGNRNGKDGFAGNRNLEGHADMGALLYRDTCPKCGARRVDSQIGLEQTPAEYVEKMVQVMREVWRVLRDDGTLWLNLGDSYAGSGKGRNADGTHQEGGKQGTNRGTVEGRLTKTDTGELKPKDLLGIPWRVAFALQDDGWYLRADIIWHKPNPMPESVTDRPTKAHEYIFLLTKSARYYFDSEAIKEPAAEPDRVRGDSIGHNQRTLAGRPIDRKAEQCATRNARSVWTIATRPYKGAHFATFPPALAEKCILAGTSERGACPHCGKAWVRNVEKTVDAPYQKQEGERQRQRTKGAITGGVENVTLKAKIQTVTTGFSPACACPAHDPVPCVVLDPFAGSGTTGVVSLQRRRAFVGIELNPEYIELARARVAAIQPQLIGG